MAEMQFEDDLRAMFEQAPAASDAAAFAERVDARIARRARLRTVLVLALGVVGLGITWLWFGLSPADFALSLPSTQAMVRSVAGPDNSGLWAVGVLVLTLALVAYQSVRAEA